MAVSGFTPVPHAQAFAQAQKPTCTLSDPLKLKDTLPVILRISETTSSSVLRVELNV